MAAGSVLVALARPFDDVLFPVDFAGKAFLRPHLVDDRHTGLVGAGRVPRDQRVPVIQLLALGQQAIGTGPGDPGQFVDIGRCQHDTIGHDRLAQRVLLAPAGLGIKQLAADIRVQVQTAVLVLELDETAFSATITQGFPLIAGHL